MIITKLLNNRGFKIDLGKVIIESKMDLLYICRAKDYNNTVTFLGLYNDTEIISLKKGNCIEERVMESLLHNWKHKFVPNKPYLDDMFDRKEEYIKDSIRDIALGVKILDIRVVWRPVRSVLIYWIKDKKLQEVTVMYHDRDIENIKEDDSFLKALNNIRGDIFEL